MDFICDLDCGIIKDYVVPIISALIPSIVAWLIYRGWNNQKGTEVIANEAKQNIKDLLEIINISYNMNSYTASPELVAEKFKRFELLSEQILRSSLFINECIVIDDFYSLLNKFNELCWDVKDIGLESDPVRNHKDFKNKLSGKVGYIGSTGMHMVKILTPYSTYQKNFLFKHK
ncbi:hypothetical protein [Acinetobacter seifertii]|uniref:hypothetical protein n=1 Tax=Acinetobacter seifertii TaxID=1530123 RepID=UPI001C0BFF8C|nr:hypothetical protein [Acinetobacter seifertii]MBU3083143.1 hypothetical protein [Acinetobacter seifertii]